MMMTHHNIDVVHWLQFSTASTESSKRSVYKAVNPYNSMRIPPAEAATCAILLASVKRDLPKH